jgi:hypothetical protein
MVGPPQPQVVADDVVAVDHQTLGGLADAGAADPEEDVVERGRVGGVVRRGSGRADLHQGLGVGGTRVDQQTGEVDAVHVRGGDGGHAVVRDQGGETEAEHHGVGPGDVQRAGQVVDAGREQQVLPGRQRVVEVGRGVARLGDEEVRDRQ